MKLKKSLLILLLLAGGFSLSTAQGIRAGWQRAAIVHDTSLVQNPLQSFYAGITHTHYLGENHDVIGFGLNTGFEYTQCGNKGDENNYRKIHYLSIPLGLRFKLGPVFIQGGPNLNFKVAEKLIVNGADALNDQNKTATFDLPIHAGAGIILGPLTIEGRYHYGILDVNNGNKNAYLQLGLAYRFGEE